MAKSKNKSVNVVDSPTNRNVHFRFEKKRVRDAETGEKTETTELRAVVGFKTTEGGGRTEEEFCPLWVDDETTQEQRDTFTAAEMMDHLHGVAEGKLGYS